jgi:L-asparaginase II
MGLSGEPVVEVRRGGLVESVHTVIACASNERGEIELALGAIDEPVYTRSSIKPFIAAAVIRAGAADAFDFDDRELALISASHDGTAEHVRTARSILAKAGIEETALRCGAHVPYDRATAEELIRRGEAPTALQSNCSGKHAGILALAKTLGAPLEGYLEPSHPAQQAILAICARLFGVHVEAIPLAVDGCGIPTLAISMRNTALGFARFATLEQVDDADALALARVSTAMTTYPWYVAGEGRFDTVLMETAGAAIACKGGAEGVHCDALIEAGLGLAVKIVDGASRAVSPAVCAALRALDVWRPEWEAPLAAFAQPVLKNVAGRTVGEIHSEVPPSAVFVR